MSHRLARRRLPTGAIAGLALLGLLGVAACAPETDSTAPPVDGGSGGGSGSASGGTESGGSGSGGMFLAFQSTFDGYASWEAFPIPHSTMFDGVHNVGQPLVAYLNKRPPTGAKEFPVGTIIVKEPQTSPVVGRLSFAMVKRGGGYNTMGATNWEWFEIERLADDKAQIVWRGVAAPLGQTYSSNPSGACNGCHVTADDNDFVWSAPLDLSELTK